MWLRFEEEPTNRFAFYNGKLYQLWKLRESNDLSYEWRLVEDMPSDNNYPIFNNPKPYHWTKERK